MKMNMMPYDIYFAFYTILIGSDLKANVQGSHLSVKMCQQLI